MHVGRGDARRLVFVHDRLGVHLGRVAVERHVHDRFLQLGRELRAQRLEQLDRFGVRHQVRAVGVKIGAEGGVAFHVVLDRGRGRVRAVHLGLEGLELGQRQVRGAALGRRLFAVRGGREGGGAFRGQRRGQDVGGGVQVVLRVAADELLVGGEADVAFQHARAHRGGGEVRFDRVFGEHQGRAAVADRERGDLGGLVLAGHQLVLERAGGQLVDQVERARAIGRRGPGRAGEVVGGGILGGVGDGGGIGGRGGRLRGGEAGQQGDQRGTAQKGEGHGSSGDRLQGRAQGMAVVRRRDHGPVTDVRRPGDDRVAGRVPGRAGVSIALVA